MISKILLAVNEQNESSQSVKYTRMLAEIFGSRICLVNIIPDFENFSLALDDQEKHRITDWVDNKLLPDTRNNLEKINNMLKTAGLDSNILIKRGIPSEQIVKTGTEEDADLIVLDKGMEYRKYLLGGTALKVLRSCDIPVLTLNDKAQFKGIKSILVPIDLYHVIMKFSLKYLVDYITSISEKLGAMVTKLYVVETGNHSLPSEIINKIKEDSLRKISVIGNPGFLSDVEVNTAAWSGIVEYASREKFDLVVVTRYIGRDFRPKFLGSTAEKVIQEARCPVITINP